MTSKCHANFIFRYVQKKMNELNKVNYISKINENLVSLYYAKFENTFHAANSQRHFRHDEITLSLITRNSDCTPISPNADTPAVSFYAILWQRSAKINAISLQ
jgi:hypothetical protein